MALISTVGDSSANSYVSLAEADVYYADSLFLDRWDALSSKEAALVTGTRIIDSLTFDGEVTSATQALQLPRSGMVDRNGVDVDDSVIPTEIKQAVYDLALYVAENPDSLTTGSGITRIKVDVIEIEQNAIELGDVSSLPSSVQRLLAPFLQNPQVSDSSGITDSCLVLK